MYSASVQLTFGASLPTGECGPLLDSSNILSICRFTIMTMSRPICKFVKYLIFRHFHLFQGWKISYVKY